MVGEGGDQMAADRELKKVRKRTGKGYNVLSVPQFSTSYPKDIRFYTV